MMITCTKGSMGRDLYGVIKCEHCGVSDKLSGGYDDGYWHKNVLPAFHCKACGLNRAGELLSPEVTVRNQSIGVNGI